MPFTANDLRYRAEQSCSALYTYLQLRAKQHLGLLKHDAYEVDFVVGHVVEQLVRIGLLGQGDHTPKTALDTMLPAQFYSFLNHSVRNKAIDRLRKRRLPVTTFGELEALAAAQGEDDPLNDVVKPLGGIPFATPEEITLALVSRQELRILLLSCIKALSNAPHQLQALVQELRAIGAVELLQAVQQELSSVTPATDDSLSHLSQHKDHAHKKLRLCLQKSSTNLAVIVSLRLSQYNVSTTDSHEVVVDIKTLMQDNLSAQEVKTGLKQLMAGGLLDWHDEEVIHLTTAQKKRLEHFYKPE